MKENPVYRDESIDQIEIFSLPDYIERIISLRNEADSYSKMSSIDNSNIKVCILQQVLQGVDDPREQCS